MNPVIDRPEGDAGWRPNLRLYQEIYRRMAAAAGLLVIDHSGAWQAVLDQGETLYHSYVPDGLHPNAEGYRLFVTPVILKAIGAPVLVTGDWTTGAVVNAGQYGVDYLHDGNAGKGTKSVRFTATLPMSGNFPVYMRWVSDPNRATNVPVDIQYAGGVATVSVNQQQQGGLWVLLGTYPFTAGTTGSVLMRTDSTNGYVVADAIGVDMPSVMVWANDGLAAEPGGAAAVRSSLLILSRTGSLASPLDVQLQVAGTASSGTDYTALPTSVTIPVGAASVPVPLIPKTDAASEGDESVSIQVVAGSGYAAGFPSKTTVTILDRPVDAWRHAHFTSQQLAIPAISGDAADPDLDGIVNLLEYISDSDPNTSAQAVFGTLALVHSGSDDYLAFTFNRAVSTDLVCIPEVSTDMLTWNASTIEQTLLADDGVMQTVTARDTVPVQAGGRRFLRLRVLR